MMGLTGLSTGGLTKQNLRDRINNGVRKDRTIYLLILIRVLSNFLAISSDSA